MFFQCHVVPKLHDNIFLFLSNKTGPHWLYFIGKNMFYVPLKNEKVLYVWSLHFWVNYPFRFDFYTAAHCCSKIRSWSLPKPRRFIDLKWLWNAKSQWITTPPLTVIAPNAETSGHPERKPLTLPPHCIPSLHLPSLSNKVTWPDPYLGSERGSSIYPHPSSLPHGCGCSREGWER